MSQPLAVSKRIGAVSELTVITPIRKGLVPGELRTHRQRLLAVFDTIHARVSSDIKTAANLLNTIHFARWFIIDPEPGRLVFTSNFDGDLKQYFRDFSLLIPDDMDSVWSNCEGYPSAGARDFEGFWTYFRQHQIETLTWLIGMRHQTVKDIQHAFQGSALSERPPA